MEFNFDRIDLGNITHDLAHLVVDDVNKPGIAFGKSKYRTIGIRAIGNRTNDYLSINRSIEDEFHADVE